MLNLKYNNNLNTTLGPLGCGVQPNNGLICVTYNF